MLFSVGLQSSGSGSATIVSGNSWSECLAWAEGTGDVIQSIVTQQQNLIVNNPSSQDSYQVGLKNNVTMALSTYLIYDTYDNVVSWINSQSNVTVQNIQYQKRAFVQL